MEYRPTYLWYYELLSFGRNEGGFNLPWGGSKYNDKKLTLGSKYHMENWTRGQNIIGKSTPGSIYHGVQNTIWHRCLAESLKIPSSLSANTDKTKHKKTICVTQSTTLLEVKRGASLEPYRMPRAQFSDCYFVNCFELLQLKLFIFSVFSNSYI